MKKSIILLFILCSLSIFAQDKFITELNSLTKKEEYKKIIDDYSTKKYDYSAESLYQIGHAFYMSEDDNNCLKFINLSIAKNSKDPRPYFILGSTLYYLKKYDEAIKSFENGIKIDPEDSRFYSGLGDTYYAQNKTELALNAYINATKQKNAEDVEFRMVAQLYAKLKNNQKALEAYYAAKAKTSPDSDKYINVLFNIGILEVKNGNYEKSEIAYLEVIKLSPTDFHTYAKLIQIYYHKKEYEKAKPYKDKLYAEYKKGNLKDHLKDMYCYDRFKWNDKLIECFERFQETSENIFKKHIFYVVNDKDEVDYTIQTEFSPIAVEHGYEKYVLCATKGNVHHTYGIGFNEDLKYEDLKKSVIQVLEDKIKPDASSVH
ncbi:MAG: tetratricopeptide repeat protein [Bacteroidota bacterium]